MTDNLEPFERSELIDKPGIVGAKWWHASLVDEAARIARRDAIRNILIVGGVVAGFGALLSMCVKAVSSSDPPDWTEERRTSLDMQKQYGWNFGAVGEALVFNGLVAMPFDPAALPRLTDDLRPGRADLVPYYQATLFQSPYAIPKALSAISAEDAAAFKPLADVLRPISTPAMNAAYERGKSLASLFASLPEAGVKPSDSKVALVVDLDGPEAVAFAAGAARVFDPVFLFDNWPHPRSVVGAHETLSAATYYQPLFAREHENAQRPRLPMFVLDRRRLATYGDDAAQFDNRYVAKVPWPAPAMDALGVRHILYVVPRAADTLRELDDLNDDFVGYARAGIDVKCIALDVFGTEKVSLGGASVDPRPPPAADKRLAGDEASDALLGEAGFTYYGANRLVHFSFFNDYPYAKPPRPPQRRLSAAAGASYAPIPRTSSYSTGSAASAPQKPRPATFSTVPVVVAVGTGVLLGARYARSGSWNRSSGGWGGGGGG